MEKANPTRMNLLALRGRLEAAQKGLELLRSKREALVREFFSIVDRVVSNRDLLRTRLHGAMNALAVAMGMEGRASVESVSFAAARDLPVEIVEKNIWGVRFPDLRYQAVVRSADARNYALSGVSSHTNTAAREFEETLDIVLRIITVEMRLKRIGAEIKKTTRRINALTELVLPDLKRQIRAIRATLEEREREEIFRIKQFRA